MTTEDELFAAFEAQFEDVTVEGVEDISKLSDFELLDRYAKIDEQLKAMDQLHHPRSQEARELHSVRAAIRIEQLKREEN